MRPLLVATALAVAGCAHGSKHQAAQPQPTLYWRKAGATQEDYNVQVASCRMKLAMVPEGPVRPDSPSLGNAISQAGDVLANTATRAQFMQDCMVVAGWRLEP